jgi:DMSO/TMAO reductase YedYZ molybdopterin-dependent catalytic subunit
MIRCGSLNGLETIIKGPVDAILSALFLFRKPKKEKQRLPPDQRWIDHILGWGTEHRGIAPSLPEIALTDWRLKVNGLVENPHEYTWEEFMGLPQVISISDFHCVETWSVQDQKWEGVLFKTILDEAVPQNKARYVLLSAYDTYTTSLPLVELVGDDVSLAHRLNDEALPQPLGGPMRLVVPHKYGYKSIMWLNEIEFSDRDKLGYWERGAYNNNANPWHSQRYG